MTFALKMAQAKASIWPWLAELFLVREPPRRARWQTRFLPGSLNELPTLPREWTDRLLSQRSCLTECISQLVLESQLPHETVDFRLVNTKLMVLWGS